MAERVGFEPTVPARGTTVFETAPFDHSGTSPGSGRGYTAWDAPPQGVSPAATSCSSPRDSINKARGPREPGQNDRYRMPGLVHIGLAKAASTYLQTVWHLSPQHHLCNVRPFLSDAGERIKRGLTIPALALDAAWSEQDRPAPVISNEGLCQAFLNETEHQHAIVRYQREIARSVGQSAFAHHVLLVVREPLSWLRSLHEQSLKQGGHWHFREFLTRQRAFVEAISDLRTLAAFWQEAGLDVTLLPVEWLRDEEDLFWNTLEARTGCPVPPDAARRRARKGRHWRNASVGDRQRFLLMANHFLFGLRKAYGGLKGLPPEFVQERAALARQFDASAHWVVRRVAEFATDRDIDRLVSSLAEMSAAPDADQPPASLIAHLREHYVGFLESRTGFPADLVARYGESLDSAAAGKGATEAAS